MKNFGSTVNTAETVRFDEGLRSFMIGVFNNMAIGLVFTAIVSWAFANIEPLMSILYKMDPTNNVPVGMTPLGYIFVFAPLFFVLMMPSIVKLSVNTVRLVFFAFAGIMGISLSNIFLVYTSESVTGVFFMTASVFGAMSIYGNVTKKDLTSIGSFCMMGLIGVIIASVVNLFLASSALYFATSLISVFVFVGLTAYDVQNMKRVYMGAHGHASEDQVSKLSLSSALQLYMNFINLFLALLRLFGDRKN